MAINYTPDLESLLGRRSMKQAHMLQQAVAKALQGEQVLVTAVNHQRAVDLKRTAREAVANTHIQTETQTRINFRSGGSIRFHNAEREGVIRGFSGAAYLVADSGEDWTTGSVPFLAPDKATKNRFERINDNDD